MAQHALDGVVELAALVIVRGRGEFVVEAEPVEEGTQHRIVVRGEAVELAERIGDAGQRLAEMLAQHVAVGDVVGHLAQAVHVVAERDQARRLVAQRMEGVAHHRRAQHFVERADMRQARRAIAGFEQDRCATGLAVRKAFQQLARLFERPGLGVESGGAQIGIGHDARRTKVPTRIPQHFGSRRLSGSDAWR